MEIVPMDKTPGRRLIVRGVAMILFAALSSNCEGSDPSDAVMHGDARIDAPDDATIDSYMNQNTTLESGTLGADSSGTVDASSPQDSASHGDSDQADSDIAPSDAGDAQISSFPPDEDSDGDGLINRVELSLGTDPRYRDTDMDGISDDIEVGTDPNRPTDSDQDTVIDALENPRFDNDRDSMYDDVDPAEGWQVVYGRFVPAVLANNGDEPTRFELKLTNADGIEAVSVGMSTTYYNPDWAPDELEVDGTPVNTEMVQLFDDGTHGDVIADDNVYSRGAITTRMAIRGENGRFNGKRCRVVFNQLSVTTSTGIEQLMIGSIDNTTSTVIPGLGFWLPIVRADLVETPQIVTDVGQRASHVLNIVDPELAMALRQLLTSDPSTDQRTSDENRRLAHSITAHAFSAFDSDFDFIYAFTSEPMYTSLAGFYVGLGNDVKGIGRDVQPPDVASGSRGRLRGLLAFRMGIEFPLNHETMHSWGVALQPTIGTDDGHWGTAGTFGVLGGFDPDSLIDNADGTFLVGHFSESGNDWRTTPFSTIELYLMGLVAPSDVLPIPVLNNIVILNNDAAGVSVEADVDTVTIDQIVAAHGARIPAFEDSQKVFNALFVLVSDRTLGRAELALINHIAQDYGRSSNDDFLSFEQATGGRATLTTQLPTQPSISARIAYPASK